MSEGHTYLDDVKQINVNIRIYIYTVHMCIYAHMYIIAFIYIHIFIFIYIDCCLGKTLSAVPDDQTLGLGKF